MSRIQELEAELAASRKENESLKAEVLTAGVKAKAHCYVSKKTGKIWHGVQVTGDFFPVQLNLARARDVVAVVDQIAAAADYCEANLDQLAEEATAKFKAKLAA